jgi:nucleoid-associated protein YgaU
MSIAHLGGIAGKAIVGGESQQRVLILHEIGRPKLYVGRIDALFNPSQLSYSRDVSWAIDPISGQTIVAASPRVEFKSSAPQTLSIELFFDTYEGGPPLVTANGGVRAPSTTFSSASAVDVTPFTNQVSTLATVFQELHRPPRCQLWWGQYLLIRGVLTNVREQFTFFLADGTPVRAVVNCTFTEAIDEDDWALVPELHSADVPKRRVVRLGDTLSSIALEEYNDATLWRQIAVANRIDDPRNDIKPGRVLLIPSLPVG